MKEIFLSFRPEYLEPILYGMKKYEYRKRFCNEETRAYLYLSGYSRMVIGVMNLGVPVRMDLRREEYKDYPDTLKRVDEYIKDGTINAVPIKSLELFSEPISLDDIRKKINNFMPPQMYYVLDNNQELKDILGNIKLNPKIFEHKHEGIYYDNLAVSVSKMKDTEEFKRLQALHKDEFKNIKF